MDFKDFQEKSVTRYVRDDFMIEVGSHKFFTYYDYPFIEEIRAFASTSERRIALLTRDVFDYLGHLETQGVNHLKAFFEATDEERAKPKKLEYVTYGSDISGFDIPFDLRNRQFILHSERESRQKLFTVNFRMRSVGPVVMTASREKTGRILMFHQESDLPQLLEAHLDWLNGGKYYDSQDLWERAIKTFDAIMWDSHHVV